ncbi:hypothetical protein J6590_002459 [Homalodisca vitripennis]|nr:hypothetical protein J6590_002459 [Homalodisca vitripennis]
MLAACLCWTSQGSVGGYEALYSLTVGLTSSPTLPCETPHNYGSGGQIISGLETPLSMKARRKILLTAPATLQDDDLHLAACSI